MVQDGTNISSLMKKVAKTNPDLLEVRLDKVRHRELIEEIGRRRPFPLIATDRSSRHPRARLEQLSCAARTGFDFVDVDLSSVDSAAVKRLKSEGAEVIASFHDNSQTPTRETLAKVLRAEERLGSDVCKIVTTARRPLDNLRILSFVQTNAAKARLVSFAMGKKGIPSRILSPFFGAEFTFAALSSQSRTAEGQLTIDELRSAWQIFGF